MPLQNCLTHRYAAKLTPRVRTQNLQLIPVEHEGTQQVDKDGKWQYDAQHEADEGVRRAWWWRKAAQQ
eukprot:7286542-Prymnesium_polylepis.1